MRKTFDVIICLSEQLIFCRARQSKRSCTSRTFSYRRPSQSLTSTQIGTCTIVSNDTVTTVKSLFSTCCLTSYSYTRDRHRPSVFSSRRMKQCKKAPQRTNYRPNRSLIVSKELFPMFKILVSERNHAPHSLVNEMTFANCTECHISSTPRRAPTSRGIWGQEARAKFQSDNVSKMKVGSVGEIFQLHVLVAGRVCQRGDGDLPLCDVDLDR